MLALSCSGAGSPVIPDSGEDLTPQAVTQNAQTRTHLWGYYDVIFDLPSKTVEVIPNRSIEFTVNIVKFLNNDPVGIQFSFNGTTPGAGYVDVDLDVTIKHPLDDAGFNGYDVRGIFIGDGSGTLNYNTDLKYPVNGTDQILLNADGYSRWFNPTEFWVPKIWGYVPGNYAPPDYTGSATLNPYKYFGEGMGATDNVWNYLTSGAPNTGYFLAGSSNTRNYQVRLPLPDPGIKYGYAVTADWAGEAPQFHPAHAPEAVGCKVTDTSNVYYNDPTDNGGNLILDISVFDWDAELTGGVMEDYIIFVESSVLSWMHMFTTTDMTPIGGGEHYSTYHVEIPADNVTGTEGNEFWVIVEDSNADYTNPFGVPNDAGTDLPAACFRYGLMVMSTDFGWTRTWGDSGSDRGYALAVDSSGNAYVTGYRTVPGSKDSFLAKYSPSGDQQWELTWGGTGTDCGYGVAIDAEANIYVTGYFQGSVDFDPGPGNEIQTSYDLADVFLSKFESNGNFLWARTWGGPNNDYGQGVSADGAENVYVTGQFASEVDFNPAGGTVYVSNGADDAFLSKFDSSGSFSWARVWGGSGSDAGRGVTGDSSGNAYVTGVFLDSVDFDPSGGTLVASNGGTDAYLSKFDPLGNFQWVRTWGGTDGDIGFGVAVDGSGSVYVTGGFQGEVDFYPGIGTDLHNSNGSSDVYLSSFGTSGSFQWARTWGGSALDEGYGVAANSSGAVFVTGGFQAEVDFNPEGGTARLSNGGDDVFLSRFDSSGSFQWVRTWGGNNLDRGRGVGIDPYGNVFAAGRFRYTADFAPSDPPCNEDPDMQGSHGACDVFLSKFRPDGCW